MPRLLGRFSKNEDGVSAVEFALIAPFMLLLYFGGIELSLLFEADRRVTNISSTIGDLASRATALTDDDIEDIFASTELLLAPLDPDEIQLRISSLVAAPNGDVTVDWSDANDNLTPRAPGSSVEDLPEDIVPVNGSVIFSEVIYEYESSIGFLPAAAEATLQDRFFLRPRRTVKVARIED